MLLILSIVSLHNFYLVGWTPPDLWNNNSSITRARNLWTNKDITSWNFLVNITYKLWGLIDGIKGSLNQFVANLVKTWDDMEKIFIAARTLVECTQKLNGEGEVHREDAISVTSLQKKRNILIWSNNVKCWESVRPMTSKPIYLTRHLMNEQTDGVSQSRQVFS